MTTRTEDLAKSGKSTPGEEPLKFGLLTSEAVADLAGGYRGDGSG